MAVDEQTAAKLLWQVKAIATKEFESLPHDCKQNMFTTDMISVTSEDSSEVEELSDRRRRTVSIESMDMLSYSTISPKPVKTITIIDSRYTDSPGSPGSQSDTSMEHHDWSKRVASTSCDDSLAAPSLTSSPTVLITQKYGKRKRENFVGLSTKAGTVRATLRKKFSWKQYPELEEYLISNQDEYFEFSSRNYTAEQRKYNNTLTRGLLDLASEEGYVFEEFTFSMVRDRIRCYYKSHSQSAKKKRRR